ncbi:hypothetical protein A2U01_0063832, partial [Trifolium medium]|nr:hypothetical protein [Trifolium medium]
MLHLDAFSFFSGHNSQSIYRDSQVKFCYGVNGDCSGLASSTVHTGVEHSPHRRRARLNVEHSPH